MISIKVSKEESEREQLLESRLMEEGVGFAEATATSPLLSKDRIARKTIQAEDAAVKTLCRTSLRVSSNDLILLKSMRKWMRVLDKSGSSSK